MRLANSLLLIMVAMSLVHCTRAKAPVDNHLHTFVDADISSLDPIQSTNRYNSLAVATVFEGLYHYNYLQRPYTIEPLLAEGLPEISPDGLIYRIRIKKGVRFHPSEAFSPAEDREVVANDFIYSWKRLADPRNRALGWWALDGWIEGLNDWRTKIAKDPSQFAAPVSGLQALSSHLLEIRLTRPSELFLHRLTFPVVSVVAKEVVERFPEDPRRQAIGTGAFRLTQWIPGTSLQFSKNPLYHLQAPESLLSSPSKFDSSKKQNEVRLPFAELLTLHIFREHQPLWLSFLKGEVDHAIVPRDLASSVYNEADLLPEYQSKGFQVLEQKKPDVVYIALNMEHPVLGQNLKLRQALAHATDRKTILKSFYNGRGQIANGPIPPDIVGYDATLSDPYPYDLSKARQLLVEAGYPNGKGLPVFDYHAPNFSSFARQFAEFIKDQWAKIGVQIRIVNNTWPQFDQSIKSKQATLFDMAWNADYPDAENFLQLFYSENLSPGPNNFNFKNALYDELYRKSLSASLADKKSLYPQMRDIVLREIPAIFLIHRTFRIIYQPWLENFHESPLIYDHFKYLRVNRSKKREFLKKLR